MGLRHPLAVVYRFDQPITNRPGVDQFGIHHWDEMPIRLLPDDAIRSAFYLRDGSHNPPTVPMALTVFSPTEPDRPIRRSALDAATQIAVLGVLWSSYALVRQVTGDTRQAAIGNAARLLDIEARLGIDIEAIVQSAIGWRHVFVAANSYYLVHFPLTLAIVVLTFWRHRTTVYPVLRHALIGSTAVALLLHLIVPMAPPRMLPGFIDAGATFGPDPYSMAGSESANQFAALPSLHVAWAVLAGYAVWRLSHSSAVRALAVLHPIITAAVVIVTGHHFVADVAIGAALAVGFVVFASTERSRRPQRWLTGSRTARATAAPFAPAASMNANR